MRVRIGMLAGAALMAAGCGSPPAAEVSKSEMRAIRGGYAALTPGAEKDAVLSTFKAGNTVKLGTSAIEGATIEEWKAEAFRDEKARKDLFVTFLYFCDGRFVDSSDTRIDYRNNAELVARWRDSVKK